MKKKGKLWGLNKEEDRRGIDGGSTPLNNSHCNHGNNSDNSGRLKVSVDVQ